MDKEKQISNLKRMIKDTKINRAKEESAIARMQCDILLQKMSSQLFELETGFESLIG